MAKGRITWINPPENKGKILRTDVTPNVEYEYNIASGDTVDGYIPKLNDPVSFIADDPNKRARQVQLDGLDITKFVYIAAARELVWESVGGATSGIIDKIGNVPVPNGTIPAGRETPPFVLTITDGVTSVSRESQTIA